MSVCVSVIFAADMKRYHDNIARSNKDGCYIYAHDAHTVSNANKQSLLTSGILLSIWFIILFVVFCENQNVFEKEFIFGFGPKNV